MKLVRPCVAIAATLSILCCVVYPALVTVAAHALFPREADGSLLERGGEVRGSSLLGQTFEHPELHLEYFWGRPSAATVDTATGVIVSAGSNEGPLSPTLRNDVAARIAALRATGVTGAIPIDLVTTSASGLDPHISPAAAEVQVSRVAHARHASLDAIRALVNAHTQGRTWGLLGEPRVNVLALNLDLDETFPR